MAPFLIERRTSSCAALLLAWCFIIMIVGPARSQSCEECQELKQTKARLHRTMTDERSKLNEAQGNKNFREIVEINKRMSNISKDLNEVGKQIVAQEQACESACRPEVVQEARCRKIMQQIDEIESKGPSNEVPTAKVDDMYKGLRRCNKELKQMER